MGKQLLLVRHGKSDWGNSDLRDFDRPLNARGHKNAQEMAARILTKNQVPQSIVSSPALRAITTAKHFAAIWKLPYEDIRTELSIYEANAKALLKVITGLDNQYERVAMFGHNPGFTDLVNYLSNAAMYDLPTCGTVYLSFNTDNWEEISAGTARLIDYDYPKNEDV